MYLFCWRLYEAVFNVCQTVDLEFSRRAHVLADRHHERRGVKLAVFTCRTIGPFGLFCGMACPWQTRGLCPNNFSVADSAVGVNIKDFPGCPSSKCRVATWSNSACHWWSSVTTHVERFMPSMKSYLTEAERISHWTIQNELCFQEWKVMRFDVGKPSSTALYVC